jgi:dihydropteroate synthase
MAEQFTGVTTKIKLKNGRALEITRPLIMGILNVTPDSFSDGGRYPGPDEAIEAARRMIDDGADIIDVGGESTRPGSEPVSPETELDRVIPVIRGIRSFTERPISIDTTKAGVAREALAAGADIVNDISAFRFDKEMIEVVAEASVPIVLMHMQGKPKTMQHDPFYTDCINEIMQFFSERIHYCLNYGITQDRLILDPGIGFGKRLGDNLMILSKVGEFRRFDCPVMVGASRKSFIGMAGGTTSAPETRIGGSIAAALIAIINGASIIRVHDIPETIEAIKIYQAIRDIG